MLPVRTHEYVGISRGVDRTASDSEEGDHTKEWTGNHTEDQANAWTAEQTEEEDEDEDAISWSFDDDIVS